MNQANTYYTLTDELVTVEVSALGAGIRTIRLRTAHGDTRNIAMSFRNPELYADNSLYAGATLAPAAGRIKNGALVLDGVHHSLTRNENNITHLHGGTHNLSFSLFEVIHADSVSVLFRHALADGVDGYPGNRTFQTEYRLQAGSLTILQRMESDLPSYANLSNHTYYNLNGFYAQESLPEGLSGLCQFFQTDAQQVLINDKNHIPMQQISTAKTPFDFTAPATFADKLHAYKNSPQLHAAKGYNHYFLTTGLTESPACILQSFDRQIEMRLYTSAPAFVLYTGGFIDNSYELLAEQQRSLRSYPGCGVALEPTSLLPPLYRQSGRYSFCRTTRLLWSLCS